MKRLLNWWGGRRARLERDLERELQYHLERRISDLAQSGVPRDEAQRRAVAELGGVAPVREYVQDEWLIRWLREFVQDLRYAARSFARTPAFALVAVLSLGLGIGATTSIYSLVDQVLLRLLPIHQPERLVLIDWKGEQLADGWGSGNLLSYPLCRDLQLQERFFDGVVCRHPTTVSLTAGSEAKPAAAEIVSGSYFTVLGVGPALGRVISVDDDRTPGAHPVVVLSFDFWRNHLGGDAGVIGRKVLVNSHPMTVIGVARNGFRGVDIGEAPALWIPAAMKAQATPAWDQLLNRRARWMHVFGRLKHGLTPSEAQAGLQPWFKAMLDADLRGGLPGTTAEQRKQFMASTIVVTPAPQGRSGLRRQLTQPLWILFSATALLFALACSNVAGLFLARGSARQRELTTRMALGASRARIARQLLADGLLIAFAGGLLGVLLAPVTARALISFLPQDAASFDLEASIDTRLLTFAVAMSSCAGILCGLAPALQCGRVALTASLGDRSGNVFGGVRLRKALVTGQVALTLVLLIGTALFSQTLFQLLAKGPGFSTSSLISFEITPLRTGVTPADASRLIRRVHSELAELRSIRSHGAASSQLLAGGSWNGTMTIQMPEQIVTDRIVHRNAISPGLFSTLGARIVMGRDFNESDTLPPDKSGFRSAIVNEAFVRRYLGTRNPIGVRVANGAGANTIANIQIVGVVTDFSYRQLREESEQVFFPIFEGRGSSANFYLRTHGKPEAAIQDIRAVVKRADPNLPIDYVRTLDEQIERSLMTERLLATVSSGFAALALLLSLVGLYGVMSFVVTQRTREIGVRLALGATRGSALWMVFRDAAIMVGTGIVIALPCAWALGRVVEAQLFGVTSTDPATIAAATAVLAAATLGAALLPAYRASKVNPIEALRVE